ncbi:hypothetical protein RchiOBHm_Chr3g0485631 [Rosa chinensis]|uniref:Uncharacterized protein n=1 Tax=Rosa chinensis TaxID=74649 RepID=A0A2P6RF23_ROSCH|nr:uncharacterized protein LOC112191716 [Rosa chinensis]PRQ45022.1 hypothetical protein RchiOBHm_Chr3g0485631 [Rosa chinensis]
MASDESMTLRSCISMQEGEYDDYTDEGYDQDQPHQHLSRLSMCTSNSIYGDDQMNDDGNSIYFQGQQENGMSLYMSLLSIDSFDGDGDVDEEEESSNKKRLSSQLVLAAGMSTDDDSDTEPACYSLPATPPRLRRDLPGARGAGSILINKVHPYSKVDKEYASENEAQKALSDDGRRSRRRSRRRMMKNRSSWLSPSPFHHGAKTTPDSDDGEDEDKEEDEEEEEESMYMNVCGDHCHSFSGESEGTGMVVIARPKGGNRSLCMDMEEVKACKDLGFELEHDRTLQQQQEMIPSRLSLYATTVDTNYTTSSGGNSPIANWPISSPGDHPQEVKARLKAWAQAVALASASPTRHSS